MLFDAHLHIFDPAFPMPGNQGFVPDAFTVADYRARTAPLGIVGGAVVAASTQGTDPAPLLAAAAALGPRFVVVAEAHPGQDDAAFAALAEAGVRGVRFNLWRGGTFDIPAMLAHARAAATHGLHAELYADAATLGPHVEALAALPAGLALDHLGMTEAGLPVTVALAEVGVKVKATGFGRVALDVPRALEALARAAPRCLMAATDLPSTRAARPFADDDLGLITRILGPDLAAAALSDTAGAFYRA
ncbi:amidohydrolase family protein [Elioraea sp.]|uniref:amidohydrolase family protein n=1 Tax=Elioraea sp. TaxID=2185103 RepID=UPI0025BEE870|nr:amidohydrolase family protein [Elioraea sp.]